MCYFARFHQQFSVFSLILTASYCQHQCCNAKALHCIEAEFWLFDGEEEEVLLTTLI
jgi:hypothetical protein